MSTTTAGRVMRRRRLALSLLASASAAALAQPAMAQVAWDGDVSEDWKLPDNWSGNAEPGATQEVAINSTANGRQPVLSGANTTASVQTLAVGQVNTGSLIVRDGAVLNIGNNFLGFSLVVGGVASNGSSSIDAARFADGTLTITGAGSRVNAVNLFMGQGASTRGVDEGGAVGLVEVLDGGRLSLANGMLLGSSFRENQQFTGRGTLRVSGAGSILESTGATNEIRNLSRVEILNGAQVLSSAGSNWNIGGVGGLTVDGAGTVANFGRSVVTSATRSSFVFSEPGFLVQNGAVASMEFLQTQSSNASDSTAMLFRNGATVNAGSVGLFGTRGIMVVQDSTLNVTGAIEVSDRFLAAGQGVLSLQNANVRADSAIVHGQGRIIIGGDEGAAATGAGSYDIRSLSLPSGSRIILNHTATGLTINSNFSGEGLVQHLAGTTNFTGTIANFFG